MAGIAESIRNVWKIEDLRKRILYTLGLLCVYRLGAYVPLPGVDATILADINQTRDPNDLFGFIDLFVGGAFSAAGIFALGIMPYITASIIIQLMGAVAPYFQKLQREGEEGRRKITQLTRYGTILITGVQSVGFAINLQYGATGQAVVIGSTAFMLSTVVVLTAGTMFVMWLGERITENGIGNGISLIIMISIIAGLPQSLFNEFKLQGNLFLFLLEIGAFAIVTAGVVFITQGMRRIPVQYAKRVVGRKVYGGTTQYLPLRVNAAGVMPIIFAQSIMFVPATIASFFPDSAGMQAFGAWFTDISGVGYSLVFFFICVFFTYFYTAIAVNPKEMADTMKRQGGFIPGIRPGKQTSEFIDNILTRITLPGSIFLGFVAILPAFAIAGGISPSFAIFFGGTSLLILVGVALDTLQQVESHLLMRHYDGFMKVAECGRVVPDAVGGNQVHLKTEDEIEALRESAELVGRTLAAVAPLVLPGAEAAALDRIAEEHILDHGARPAFKGYRVGSLVFPTTLCVSVNDEVVHGIPVDRVLHEGDIVSIDCGVVLNGFYGDSAFTFAVGEIDMATRDLCRVTYESLLEGISKTVMGGRVGDISEAVQRHCERSGYGVVRDLVGHGIGRSLHEAPQVPNCGRRGVGRKLKQGLVICIEPMVNLGTGEVTTEQDGWTIRTADRRPSAHYEHMVAVGPGGPEVLTTFRHIEEAVKAPYTDQRPAHLHGHQNRTPDTPTGVNQERAHALATG